MLTAVANSEKRIAQASIPLPLEIREAKLPSDLYSAANIVASEYFDEGYLETINEHTLREILASLHACRTFLLCLDAKPVLTLSYTTRDPLPMESGELFKNEIQELRQRGWRLAEFTKLAGKQKKDRSLCFSLMAHVFAIASTEVDAITLTAHPLHRAFYLRYAGFSSLSDVYRPHPAVRGSLACGLYSHRSQILRNPSYNKHHRS